MKYLGNTFKYFIFKIIPWKNSLYNHRWIVLKLYTNNIFTFFLVKEKIKIWFNSIALFKYRYMYGEYSVFIVSVAKKYRIKVRDSYQHESILLVPIGIFFLNRYSWNNLKLVVQFFLHLKNKKWRTLENVYKLENSNRLFTVAQY